METTRRDLRFLIFHEYRLGRRTSEALSNICCSMGQGVLTLRTIQTWFREFKQKRFDLQDRPRSGRPVSIDLDELKSLIEEDPRQTLRSLARELGCSYATIERHLIDLGKTWRYGYWVPHELTDQQFQNRVDSCLELLTHHRTLDWLTNLVTGDEKWVTYVNHRRRRQWLGPGEKGEPTPKPELHPIKVMLSVWWGTRGIIYWELLPTGTTVTADVYCRQLDMVAQSLKGKQDRVYFLHDNARPHIALKTKKKILDLKWTTIPHPAYSPDLAPTDYHLFRSLANDLSEKSFENEDQIKAYLSDFFASKSPEFYRDGILSLPKRWQYVVDNNGAYYI